MWVRESNFSSHCCYNREDVDLTMILIALAPAESDIYFMKSGKGKVEAKIFSTRKLQKELSFAQTILLLHAFSGCDTTSAIYRKSKARTVNLFKNQLSQMKNIADIFYNPSSTSDARRGEVSTSGVIQKC
ncbi:hypothetical protein AVEN_3296-1 [Araneus ventricosus]|uniref:Uncharacterized protein n=1 Tax=Araneus ventricosus TaxID=182803 RepID=A0A4Y2UPH5_ARAVE|nr:hypothetical protein AVEN_3296-1 [Araneus ventricosus]